VLTLAALAVMAVIAVLTQYGRMREDRLTELHAAIDIARGFAEELDAEVKEKKLGEAEAIERFRRQIDNAWYNKKDYYFVHTMDGTIVARATDPENEGKNLIDFKDKSGRPIIREQAELARHGGGPYPVYWTRPGTSEPVEKLNYIEALPWNMWIGTGVFMDDLAASARATLQRQRHRHSRGRDPRRRRLGRRAERGARARASIPGAVAGAGARHRPDPRRVSGGGRRPHPCFFLTPPGQ
jgi:methyl-accepting chemotaxis protein